MLQAYFDESGIRDGAKVCVVGGFYGHQRAWRKFEQQWSLILTDYPELENRGFHAKEFFGRKERKRVGPYEKWTDDRAGKFLERLVQAIMRNDITPIVFGVFVNVTDLNVSRDPGEVLRVLADLQESIPS